MLQIVDAIGDEAFIFFLLEISMTNVAFAIPLTTIGSILKCIFTEIAASCSAFDCEVSTASGQQENIFFSQIKDGKTEINGFVMTTNVLFCLRGERTREKREGDSIRTAGASLHRPALTREKTVRQ